jgi:EpsI family protein
MSGLSSWQRFFPVALLLVIAVVILQARVRKEILPAHDDLATFPMQIANWKGTELALKADEEALLGPGEFLLRDYRRLPFEPPVNLFVAFYPSQRTGDTIHSPKNCLPGSGWTAAPVRLGDDLTGLTNRYVIARGSEREVVYYWYQSHGRVTASEYWAKIFLVTDAIQMNRTDGALVRIITPILNDTDEQAALSRGLEFTNQIQPLLDHFIPR